GRGGGTAGYVGRVPSATNSIGSLQAVSCGGGAERESPSPIVLAAAGQEFEANFDVALRPAYRVRGRIRNARQYQGVQVELLRGGTEVSAARALVNAVTGQFDLQDVVPGNYVLRASQGRDDGALRAEQAIVVGERDSDGLSLELAPPVEVTAKVELLEKTDHRWRAAFVVFTAEDGAITRSDAGLAEQKLRVFPGRYGVRIDTVGTYVVSATAGNVDLLATPALRIVSGAPPPPLEVIVSADGGSVSGSVPKLDGADPCVVLLPAS